MSRPSAKRGIFCGACEAKIPTEAYTGKPPRKCPSCGAQRLVRWCDECQQMRRVPTQIKIRGIYCKRCNTLRRRAKDTGDPQRVAARRDYADRNREQINARARERYAADPEMREKIKARGRKWQREHREQAREKTRAWYAAHREAAREAAERWAQAHPDLVRGYRQRHYQRLKADPKRFAAYRLKANENDRIKRRLRAEREGRTIAPVDPVVYLRRYGYVDRLLMVDTAPLRQLITEAYESDESLSGRVLAFRCQIDPRRLYAVMQEPRVSIAVADRICVGLGLTFSLVYPEAA